MALYESAPFATANVRQEYDDYGPTGRYIAQWGDESAGGSRFLSPQEIANLTTHTIETEAGPYTVYNPVQINANQAAPVSAAPVSQAPAPQAAPAAPAPAAQAQNAYFAANPDVATLYTQKTYDLTPEDFAKTHYEKYGWAEQRAAPTGIATPAFDEDLYLKNKLAEMSANPTSILSDYKGSLSDTAYLKNYMASRGFTPRQHYQQYGAAEGVSPTTAQTSATLAKTDAIENLYNTYAQRWSDPEGYAYWKQQFGDTIDANEANIFRTAVEEARKAGTESPTIYTSLTGQSTPEQIAAAYNQYVKAAGGDTAQAQANAANYLSKLGVSADTIRNAYNLYTGDYASGIAGKVFGSFGSEGATPLNGILSGFESIARGDFTEDQAKRLLGADKFNQYKDMFGQETKRFTDSLLSDKNLSGQEAVDFVQQARKYGVDANEFADLTGYRKELYDNIFKGYDKTVDSLVDKSLEGKTDLGDRIKTGLALQKAYGLTDEDIAKATDMGVEEIKGYFDPVRKFGEEFKNATSKADATGKDILSFVETAKKSAPIASVYGANLDALEQKINAANEKWKDYGVDGLQAENIYNQINKITEAAGGKNWTGSWMSGGESAAKTAARVLVQRGVDNLSDLKVEKNYEKGTAHGEFYDGKIVRQDEDGRKYVSEYDPVTESGGFKYLPPNAKTTPGVVEGSDEYATYRPLTADELKTYDAKTSKFDLAVGNKLVDKSSGKVVSKSDTNNFVLDSYSTGNFFKSTDKTFGIKMTDNGVPVPYQTSEKGGLLYSPVFPILASLALPGIGSALSSGIAGLGGSALASGTMLNSALTQGILGGTLSEVAGGDFGKGFVGGAINPVVSTGISNVLPTGMDPALARTATNVGTSAVTSALMGRPIDWTSTALNAGVQYGAQQLPFNLTSQQVNLLGGIATPLLQGQSISPERLTGILANYAMKSQTPYTAGAK